MTSRGFPYDYESVMHYSKKAFTNLGEITIKVGLKISLTEKVTIVDIHEELNMPLLQDGLR